MWGGEGGGDIQPQGEGWAAECVLCPGEKPPVLLDGENLKRHYLFAHAHKMILDSLKVWRSCGRNILGSVIAFFNRKYSFLLAEEKGVHFLALGMHPL
jgi:hypothetical protein